MAASLLSLRRIIDASLAVLAEASFVAFSRMMTWLQCGHCLVFCSALARRRPPHLLQTMTSVDFTCSPVESLFHAALDNGSACRKGLCERRRRG
jgi:hypothetical protein